MKPETQARISGILFNDLERNVEELKREAMSEYDDCAAEWYVHQIERTVKAILDYLRDTHKDKV